MQTSRCAPKPQVVLVVVAVELGNLRSTAKAPRKDLGTHHTHDELVAFEPFASVAQSPEGL